MDTLVWAHFTIAEMTHDFQWLLPLANTSSQLTDSSSEEPKAYQMLLRFGSRRHTSFLGTADGIFPDEQNIPYFGLCNPFVLDALAAESAIEFGVSNISLIPFLEFYHSNIWSIMALYSMSKPNRRSRIGIQGILHSVFPPICSNL